MAASRIIELLLLLVVLFLVDFLGHLVLLGLDLGLFLRREPLAVAAILADLAVQLRLFGFDLGGFLRGERAVFDSFGDSVLLAFLTIDSPGFLVCGLGGGRIIRHDHGGGEQGGEKRGKNVTFHSYGRSPV